jgi:hypothetical protein
MSGKNQATHDYILFKLGQALQLLLLAQRDTAVQKGYKNFALAIDIVHGCQKTFGDAWEATRDANMAMPDMASARTKLTLLHTGAAAQSIAAATTHIDEIIKALTHHLDVSPSPRGVRQSEK